MVDSCPGTQSAQIITALDGLETDVFIIQLTIKHVSIANTKKTIVACSIVTK